MSGGPEQKHNLLSYLGTTFLRSPRPLRTHQRRRTKSKAVPGRGGGGWLQRDWGLEDGSGTRVSVQSPVYVGLTASVSKAARGGGEMTSPEERQERRTLMKRLRLRKEAGWRTGPPSPGPIAVYERRADTAAHTPVNPQRLAGA